MFVSQAHSYRQQARLAVTLAWVAGYTNIITILACGHVTSHVSGTTSDFGRGIASADLALAAFTGMLLITFLLGAMISGVAMELGRRRGWESVYVLPIAIEAALLAAFAFGIEFTEGHTATAGPAMYALTALASAAMGVQNATITRISGGVVRTTHVTGVLTDVGLELVQTLATLRQGPPPDESSRLRRAIERLRGNTSAWRSLVLGCVVLSFALGAGLGTLAFGSVPEWAMFPPVLFLLAIIYQDVHRPIAEIEPSRLIADERIELPASIALFNLRRDHEHRGRVQRLPDLITWSDRLPPHIRIVVLDLTDVELLDSSSALELRAAARRLQGQKRELVLAGIDPAEYKELSASVHGPWPPAMHAFSDVELALAHAFNLSDVRE